MSVYQDLLKDHVSNLDINRDPTIVSLGGTVREAVEQLKENKRGCVLVCDGTVLKGIFTERDLLMRVLGRKRKLDAPIQEFMTPNPITVRLDEALAVVVKKMRNGGHRHFPVINEEGRPIGVLSVKHIVHFLADHFPEEVYNLPPDSDEALPAPEGA
ncbi:MAG: CBS domain-containing protein [Candidatus Omnitrophica bacterium]|nr:CBS domain-containing protein [Candidatus Omnitrophota bacterium]